MIYSRVIAVLDTQNTALINLLLALKIVAAYIRIQICLSVNSRSDLSIFISGLFVLKHKVFQFSSTADSTTHPCKFEVGHVQNS